jgi:hypothetical protein
MNLIINELIYICKQYHIPYKIYMEIDNNIKITNEKDNKETIIKRIKYYLKHFIKK